jgi:CBS domain-containing protein
MKIYDIMSRDPYVCDPETPLSEVAARMRDLDVGIIPVCDGRKIQGTVTDRDIVLRAVADELDPAMTVAEEVMTSEVTFCFEDEDVDEASALMEENQIRRLVVLDREMQLVGILSLGDIAAKAHDDQLAGATLEAISKREILESDIADDDIDDELSVDAIHTTPESQTIPDPSSNLSGR